jgi:hypothetical protein
VLDTTQFSGITVQRSIALNHDYVLIHRWDTMAGSHLDNLIRNFLSPCAAQAGCCSATTSPGLLQYPQSRQRREGGSHSSFSCEKNGCNGSGAAALRRRSAQSAPHHYR